MGNDNEIKKETTDLNKIDSNIDKKISARDRKIAHDRELILKERQLAKLQKVTQLRQSSVSMDISRSKKISHFHNDHKQNSTTKIDLPAKQETHPLVKSIQKPKKDNEVQAKRISSKTAKELKEHIINNALESAPKKSTKEPNIIIRNLKKIVISSIFILICLLAVTAYNLMPSLSVKIASAQAGIDASFPDYYPYGFSVDGPVLHEDSKVIIRFKSNTDNTKFTITQSQSTWDSTAVKSMITKASNGVFQTTIEKGLTIFSYDSNAAWVNGGILYQIEGDALLSTYQIGRMATGL